VDTNRTTKKKKDKKHTNDTLSYAQVSSSHPIWHCKNAYKLENPCVFSYCHVCYIKKANKQQLGRKTTRSRRIKDKEIDDNLCDHCHLMFFTDSLFYSDNAIKEKKEEDDIYFPFKCVECHQSYHS